MESEVRSRVPSRGAWGDTAGSGSSNGILELLGGVGTKLPVPYVSSEFEVVFAFGIVIGGDLCPVKGSSGNSSDSSLESLLSGAGERRSGWTGSLL